MVRLTRIYTRGGDAGQTSLGDGTRVAKDALRVDAYGTVDEANGTIGLARLHTQAAAGGGPADGAAAGTADRAAGRAADLAEADAMLARIQNDLFDLGADLCMPEAPAPRHPPLRVTDAQVDRLEREIDRMNDGLRPLDSFVLPGGTPAAAWLHLARTVVRRAERLIVALAAQEPVNPAAIRYANRLSDHLFVLARWTNDRGVADVLWVPGANR